MTYAYGLPTGMKMTGLKSFHESAHMGEAVTPGLYRRTVPEDESPGRSSIQKTYHGTVPIEERSKRSTVP